MNLQELKTNPSNPRRISDKQFEKLKKSISSFTKMLEVRPIAYDSDGVIWGGNMRYQALKALEIPLEAKFFKELIDYTPEEKREFAIRDNVELGEWDDDILANEWSDLPLNEWGILTGSWQDDLDVNEMWKGMPDFNGIKEGNAFRSIIIHFETQEQVDNFAKLLGQTITEKTKYLWFPRKEKQDLKSLEVTTDES